MDWAGKLADAGGRGSGVRLRESTVELKPTILQLVKCRHPFPLSQRTEPEKRDNNLLRWGKMSPSWVKKMWYLYRVEYYSAIKRMK